ncbi:hypothetical protein [Modestobacter sp. SYSU DS0511]
MPLALRQASRRLVFSAALSLALPAALLGGATARAESPPAAVETVVGELVQAYVDPGPGEAEEHGAHGDGGHEDGEDTRLSWVRGDDGDTVRVPTEAVDHVELGATVQVTLGDEVRDEAAAEGLEPAREVLTAQVVAPAEEPPTAAAVGAVNHPVTVVLLQPGRIAKDSRTLAEVTAAVDGGVAEFWDRESGGAVRFGVVAGFDWTPVDATCAEPYALWQAAADRAGWTAGAGKHLLVYVPANAPGCSYGLGTVGTGPGSGGLSYVRATATSLIAHEFGHNIGLGHASARQCDAVIEGSTCRMLEYSDYYDVMGVSWEQVGSLNAPHAALLGALPADQWAGLSAAETGGSYTLAPYGDRAGLRALRLTGLDGSVYWLENRTATGADAWLTTSANWPGMEPGLLLRRAVAGSDTSLLLDGSPSPATGWGADAAFPFDPAQSGPHLIAGTFSLTVTGSTAAGVTVQVSTSSPITRAHEASGGDAGPLGPPVEAQACGLRDGGCARQFTNGWIYWTAATGARQVTGPVLTRWTALGRETGTLGYPATDPACTAAGCTQAFQRGSLAGPVGAQAWVLSGAVRDRWTGSALAGTVGFPTGDTFCGLPSGGCAQHFQRGSVYWQPSVGAFTVTGAVRDAWARTGWERGPLGYPVRDTTCGLVDGGCFQHFQGGSVYSSASTPAVVLTGALRSGWAARGWERSALGYPVAAQVCGLPSGGCLQSFRSGSLYWSSATGVRAVLAGKVRDGWARTGWERGPLGYPVGDTTCGLVGGGCFQHFQGGSVYSSASTPAVVLTGALRSGWAARGWERSALGYPVAAQVCGLPSGGCLQSFRSGSLYWSSATGVRAVLAGKVRDGWARTGWERGPLGYPVGDTTCGLVGGGCFQHFQGGSVYSSASTPAVGVTGAVRDAWAARGWERSALGYPVAAQACSSSGCTQRFQHGAITASAAGAVVVRTG